MLPSVSKTRVTWPQSQLGPSEVLTVPLTRAAESYRQPITERPDANSVYSSSSRDMIGSHTTNQSVLWKSSKKQDKSNTPLSLLGIFCLSPIRCYRGIFMRHSHFDRTTSLCLCQPAKVVAGIEQKGHRVGESRTDG